MRNLEQIRAKIALDVANKIGSGSEGGRAVAKKVPTLIVQNGFLAALAFAIESVNDSKFEVDSESGYYRNTEHGKGSSFKGCGYANTFLSVMKDLKETKNDYGLCNGDLKDFLRGLCNNTSDSSLVLRMVTEEALSYLNYLRRFAKPEETKGEDADVHN